MKNYNPPFHITNEMLMLVSEINKEIGSEDMKKYCKNLFPTLIRWRK